MALADRALLLAPSEAEHRTITREAGGSPPIFGDNGSGMHVHQSLWKDGEPLCYDETGYGGVSDLARTHARTRWLGWTKASATAGAFVDPEGLSRTKNSSVTRFLVLGQRTRQESSPDRGLGLDR